MKNNYPEPPDYNAISSTFGDFQSYQSFPTDDDIDLLREAMADLAQKKQAVERRLRRLNLLMFLLHLSLALYVGFAIGRFVA